MKPPKADEVMACYTDRAKALKKSMETVPTSGSGHGPTSFKPESHPVPSGDEGKIKR